MSKKNTNNMGKTKRSTDDLIDGAIAQQNNWLENRREYTRGFLKSLNMFARPSHKDANAEEKSGKKAPQKKERARRVVKAYWFPITCAVIVAVIAFWVLFVRGTTEPRIVVVPVVPDPVVQKVDEIKTPQFDIVRIEKNGNIVIAGRWLPHQNISIVSNGKVIATERTDWRGEFVYAPVNAWKPGNYTIALLGTDPEVKSSDRVFVYVSEAGVKNSMSLLMTKDGSTVLQSPTMLQDGDLRVSKIDYLDNGRLVVTGDALPRLRVSMAMNGKYLGFARVSDHKHFGLGYDVGELEPGKKYELAVRLHDGDGKTVSAVMHRFVMPRMTGNDDTYYTVRRGDCLWVIARNFLRRGVLFSIIAERNNIVNPDLIYPEQKLQIPVDAE